MKVFIYYLCDFKNNIRYIGKTNNLKRRLKSHIKESKSNKKSHKISWIKSLLKRGEYPKIKVIDIVDNNEWEFWEKYWIEQFKIWGFNLTNLTKGGKGSKGYKHKKKTKIKLKKIKKNKKLSKEHKKMISRGVKKSHKRKPKYNLTKKHTKRQIILDKNLLYKKYIIENLSQPKCSDYFNVSTKVIWKNLKMFNIKKDKKTWVKQTSIKRKEKIILQYDLNGNFLKEWNGGNEIKKDLNFKIKSIRECCCGRQKTSQNYIWKYKK